MRKYTDNDVTLTVPTSDILAKGLLYMHQIAVYFHDRKIDTVLPIVVRYFYDYFVCLILWLNLKVMS